MPVVKRPRKFAMSLDRPFRLGTLVHRVVDGSASLLASSFSFACFHAVWHVCRDGIRPAFSPVHPSGSSKLTAEFRTRIKQTSTDPDLPFAMLATPFKGAVPTTTSSERRSTTHPVTGIGPDSPRQEK